jgi:hypothetical protein
VAAFNCAASSAIIVELFDALSHVTWPVYSVSMSMMTYACQSAYLMFNADTFENFEEGMTKPYTVMCIAKTCKAEKSGLSLPLRRCCLLDPMTSNRKVAISIAGLPSITCQIDLAGDRWTLEKIRKLNHFCEVCPYIQFCLECCEMVFKCPFDFRPCCLSTWDLNTIRSTCSKIDHLYELGMFKGL